MLSNPSHLMSVALGEYLPVDPHNLPVANMAKLAPRVLTNDGAVIGLYGRPEVPLEELQPPLENQEPNAIRIYL